MYSNQNINKDLEAVNSKRRMQNDVEVSVSQDISGDLEVFLQPERSKSSPSVSDNASLVQ